MFVAVQGHEAGILLILHYNASQVSREKWDKGED